MKGIRLSKKFSKDFAKFAKSGGAEILAELLPVLPLLATGEKLPQNYKDHALTGNWKVCRECHIRPDVLLVYRLPDADTLILERIGSHSELFS